MIDITILTTFLTPFLPFLLKGGEEAAKEAGKQFGSSAWRKATTVWSKISSKIEEKPAAKEAVFDLAQNPDDGELQVALRVQLKKLLAAKENEAFAEELAELMEKDSPTEASGDRIQQKVKGDKNQIIGKIEGESINFTIN